MVLGLSDRQEMDDSVGLVPGMLTEDHQPVWVRGGSVICPGCLSQWVRFGTPVHFIPESKAKEELGA